MTHAVSLYMPHITRLSHYCYIQLVIDNTVDQLIFLHKMNYLKLFFLLSVVFHNVISYKILAVLPVTSRSHYYIGHNLMKGLAEDGHDVTVISPFKQNVPIKNYKEVFLEHSWEMSRRSNCFDLIS